MGGREDGTHQGREHELRAAGQEKELFFIFKVFGLLMPIWCP